MRSSVRLFSSRRPSRGYHQSIASNLHRRRLDVAIVGMPNAGKSQLVNALCGTTVAAVSRKRHTTRNADILGGFTEENKQILLIDTPGFMRKADGVDDELDLGASVFCDYTLLVIDAARNLTYHETLIQLIAQALEAEGRIELSQSENGAETIEAAAPIQSKLGVVLNKVDLVHPKSQLMDLAIQVGDLAEETIRKFVPLQQGEDIVDRLPMFFYVSALKHDGVDDVKNYLLDLATPSQEWMLEEHQSTNSEPIQVVEEVVREKLYRNLHQEVPYQIRQGNKVFKTMNGGVLIHQELRVRTKSHQQLLLGKTLERIQEAAQRDLQKMWRFRVVLYLHVKLVRSKNWSI